MRVGVQIHTRGANALWRNKCADTRLLVLQLELLVTIIIRFCDWEIFSAGCSRPGRSREACVTLYLPLQYFLYSWGLVYSVILTLCFLL